jgi:hypothetical protein
MRQTRYPSELNRVQAYHAAFDAAKRPQTSAVGGLTRPQVGAAQATRKPPPGAHRATFHRSEELTALCEPSADVPKVRNAGAATWPPDGVTRKTASPR